MSCACALVQVTGGGVWVGWQLRGPRHLGMYLLSSRVSNLNISLARSKIGSKDNTKREEASPSRCTGILVLGSSRSPEKSTSQKKVRTVYEQSTTSVYPCKVFAINEGPRRVARNLY